MNKRPISVTLSPDNLCWLETTARRTGQRSLSETLDRILDALRGTAGAGARPVRGLLAIDGADPDLLHADAAVRSLFTRALGGASVARDAPARKPRSVRRPSRTR